MSVALKEQCPGCAEQGRDNSGDNLVNFDNGTKFCFQCKKDTTTGSKEVKVVQPPIDPNLMQGEYVELVKRGISEKTCRKYGYMINRQQKVHIANVYNDAGTPVYQKIRGIKDKSFYSKGDKSHSSDLYGQHLFTPNPKVFITITEGELDCLSVYEAFAGDFDTPVVSLMQGIGSAEKSIRKHLDYLQGFKYVVLAFDNDEVGREATEACLRHFEPGKLRLVTWPQKDASDLLQAGRAAEIKRLVWRAKEYMPEPIKTGAALMKTLIDYKTKSIKWPWEGLNSTIQPIAVPAVYTIAAKPAVGKTLFCAELMREAIDRGGKVGVVALEETIQRVVLKLTSSIFNVDLTSPRDTGLTEDELAMCSKVAENVVVYDHITYGSDIANICANIPYMVRSCGCELIIFDNITYSATGMAGNERVGIDKAMVQLKDSTVKYQYTLLNVCHLKRGEGDDDLAPMTAESIRGSQGVELYSDYIIGLDRDKTSDDATIRNTLYVHVLKDRMSGLDTGKVISLHYNHKTGRLEDNKGAMA